MFGPVAGRKQQKRCCTQLRMKEVDEETLQIYEIQREIQSLRHELREQQWTLEGKSQHEARCHAEYDDRCEVCVRVRKQCCDNGVEQVNIDLCHRVTELQDENRKLKQQVGELKRVDEKVRVEMKAMTLEFHQELDWQLKQNDADRIRLESENKSLLQEVQQCKQALDMNPKSFALKERDMRDQCARLENEIQTLNDVVVDVTVKAEQQELVLGEQSVRIRALGTEVRSLTDQLAAITESCAKIQHDLERQRVARADAEQFAVNLVQLKDSFVCEKAKLECELMDTRAKISRLTKFIHRPKAEVAKQMQGNISKDDSQRAELVRLTSELDENDCYYENSDLGWNYKRDHRPTSDATDWREAGNRVWRESDFEVRTRSSSQKGSLLDYTKVQSTMS